MATVRDKKTLPDYYRVQGIEVLACPHTDAIRDDVGLTCDLNDQTVLLLCPRCARMVKAQVFEGVFYRAIRDGMPSRIR